MKHPEDPVAALHPACIYQANDLRIWKHVIRECETGFFPAFTCFPNPVVHDDLVVACTFSPGQVVAVDKATGEARWHRSLSHLGNSPVSIAGLLLVSDFSSIQSLSPQTGVELWDFKPYEGGRNTHSLPIYAAGSVYVGDLEGVLACLSAETGKLRWSVQTSLLSNPSIYATALAFENLIITATNTGLVLAYDQATGQEVWRQMLPHNSIYQIQLYEGMALIRTSQVLYGLSPKTGEIIQQWRWRGYKIKSVAVAGATLCVAITNEPGRLEKMPPHPKAELLGVHKNGVKWRLPHPRSSGVELRWDPEARLLYEAMYCGLGIVDPETGKRIALVAGFSTDIYWATGRPDNHVGLPSTDHNRLYILHTSGVLWALQHPTAGLIPDTLS